MELATIFSDNMILQRDMEVYIFGNSKDTEELTISIDDITVADTVCGDWCIKLPPHPAGGPYDMRITAKKGDSSDTKRISNVLYGEVWLNNGQSNIELELKDSDGAELELAKDNPEIRYFNVSKAATDSEVEQMAKDESWKSCVDSGFGDVSAVGYYYALKLYKELGVPIGLIDCYVGGTSISCWTEKERLVSMPEGQLLYDNYLEAIDGLTDEEYMKKLAEFEEACAEHEDKVASLREAVPDITFAEISERVGGGPWPPPMSEFSIYRPCGIIETMLKRVAPYTIRGEVYYQGEQDAIDNYEFVKKHSSDNIVSNLNDPEVNTLYKNLLALKINQDRSLFGNDDMPFYILQLPRYIEYGQEDLRDWAYIREAQDMVSESMSGAYLVNLLDLGELGNIHPTDKKTPGLRTADVILGTVYGYNIDEDLTADSITLDGDNIYITFRNVYDGILVENDNITGFEVSKDGVNYFAPQAHISEDALVIEDAKDIHYIQYGFFNYGDVTLSNSKGKKLRQFRVCL